MWNGFNDFITKYTRSTPHPQESLLLCCVSVCSSRTRTEACGDLFGTSLHLCISAGMACPHIWRVHLASHVPASRYAGSCYPLCYKKQWSRHFILLAFGWRYRVPKVVPSSSLEWPLHSEYRSKPEAIEREDSAIQQHQLHNGIAIAKLNLLLEPPYCSWACQTQVQFKCRSANTHACNQNDNNGQELQETHANERVPRAKSWVVGL